MRWSWLVVVLIGKVGMVRVVRVVEVVRAQTLAIFLRFLEDPRASGGPGCSGGSEKHIWKIFYGWDSEIGNPGTPGGDPRDKNFF